MGVLAAGAPLSATPQTTPVGTPTPTTPSSCRIVSEQRKNRDASPGYDTPTVCGVLEVHRQGRWVPRHAEVRPGELRVFRPAEGKSARQLELRLPLRRMSILRVEDPGGLAFSLEPQRDNKLSPVPQQLPAVFRARTEQEYERWVRALAVELMRQTPLEALRFLDVLGITQARPPPHPPVKAAVSAPPALRPAEMQTEAPPHQLTRLLSADPLRARLQGRNDGASPVPVRERRRVFEGLIAASSRSTSVSTENLSAVSGRLNDSFARRSGGLRAHRSLLDLRRTPAPTPPDYPRRSVSIRELCRFFEQGPTSCSPPRPESPEEVCLNPFLSRRRLQRGQRRLAVLRERAATVEDAMWRLQEQMAELDREHTDRRTNSKIQLDKFSTLERRLQSEERSLAALQAETSRVLRGVEQAARRLDTALSLGNLRSWDAASSSGVSSDSG